MSGEKTNVSISQKEKWCTATYRNPKPLTCPHLESLSADIKLSLCNICVHTRVVCVFVYMSVCV